MSEFARALAEEDFRWLPPLVSGGRSGLVLDEDEIALDLLPEFDGVFVEQRPSSDLIDKRQMVRGGFHSVSQQSHDHASACESILAEARVVRFEISDAILKAGDRHFGFSLKLNIQPSRFAGVLAIRSQTPIGGRA